eukprot:Amastigsp_a339960_35.p4 type:complete len:143 gc:universal Amastigsp_a339960_35:2988-2560(-)
MDHGEPRERRVDKNLFLGAHDLLFGLLARVERLPLSRELGLHVLEPLNEERGDNGLARLVGDHADERPDDRDVERRYKPRRKRPQPREHRVREQLPELGHKEQIAELGEAPEHRVAPRLERVHPVHKEPHLRPRVKIVLRER